MAKVNDNLESFLYDVGFFIFGRPNSKDREAVYVPLDGSVSYDTLNDFFIEEIARKRGVSPREVRLITSMRAENVIY